VDTILSAGALPDYTFLWWDVRPHPRLGSVEVRAMDAQSSPRAVLALAALVQALAIHEAERPARAWTPREALMESSFRAARDGIGASLLYDEALRPVGQITHELLARVRPNARAMHAEAALDEVEWLVRSAGGATRQRQAFACWGMAGLLEFLVGETGARPRSTRRSAA
jgi:glutamate---cysteine ligase / carboxylate-amine ligase